MDLRADCQLCWERSEVGKTCLTSARQWRIVLEVTRHVIRWFANASLESTIVDNTESKACDGAVSSSEVCLQGVRACCRM